MRRHSEQDHEQGRKQRSFHGPALNSPLYPPPWLAALFIAADALAIALLIRLSSFTLCALCSPTAEIDAEEPPEAPPPLDGAVAAPMLGGPGVILVPGGTADTPPEYPRLALPEPQP